MRCSCNNCQRMSDFDSCQSNRTHTDGLHNWKASQIVQDLLWHLTSAYMKCVYGWAGVHYVITKFSRMDSLPSFVTHGAPLRTQSARESSAMNSINWEVSEHVFVENLFTDHIFLCFSSHKQTKLRGLQHNYHVFITGYVTLSLGCYMVCCYNCFISGRLYTFELLSFIFIPVLQPSLQPQN